jgi:hypothetical protein
MSLYAKNSPEAARLQEEIENIRNEGFARPVVQAAQPTEFATSWSHQLMALTQHTFQAYWRNPTYLMAKFVLCIVGGLLIGFTFYKTSDSLQGAQNKLFVCGVLYLTTEVVNQFDRRSSWPQCFVPLSRSSSRRCSSTFGPPVKSESAQAGCTTGPRSLSAKSWSSSHPMEHYVLVALLLMLVLDCRVPSTRIQTRLRRIFGCSFHKNGCSKHGKNPIKYGRVEVRPLSF